MPRRSLLALLLLALALPGGQRPAQAAVSAPTLKWQRGGCFTSWCQTGWYSSPAVADLDGDSKPEVIWGSYDVVALNGEDGTLQWRAASEDRVWPGVAVVDLTGDGSLEVVAGRGDGTLTAYSSAGGQLWLRNPFGANEVRSLAVADLDGDGSLEVLAGRASGGNNGQVMAYTAAGAARAGFPAPATPPSGTNTGYGWGMYNNNIAVADLDGDGDSEIVAPTDTHYITALSHTGGLLPASPIYGAGKNWRQVGVHVSHAVDLRGYADCGTEHRPNFANTAPVLADVDSDGTPEVVVVGDVYNCDVGDPEGDLYHLPWILKLDRTRWSGAGYDWTDIPAAEPGSGPLSQDYDRIENSVTSAASADLDGDGLLEILYPSYDGRLHAYWLDKTEHGAWPWDVPGSGIRFASEPAVADLDGDGTAEVIVASWPEKGAGRVGQLHVLDYLGNQLYAVDLPAPFGGDDTNGGLGAPTVANIDADPDLEVVVGTIASGAVAYDLPGSAGARCLWCTGRGGYARTGLAEPADSFSLSLAPAVQRVAPGGAATIRVTLRRSGAFSQAVTVGAGSDRGADLVDVATPGLTPPGETTVTVTVPGGAALPGTWRTVTITAAGGGITRTARAYVLAGGAASYLPTTGR